MRFAIGALLLVAALVGCGSATTPAASPVPSVSATGATTRTIQDYRLYTHCGIREARIGSEYYEATPVLDDGNANPPDGWGNPFQLGTMTVNEDGSAHFSAPGGLEATFRLRSGATAPAMLCA